MRRDTKEVLAELVGKLKEKLDPKKPAATSVGEKPKLRITSGLPTTYPESADLF